MFMDSRDASTALYSIAHQLTRIILERPVGFARQTMEAARHTTLQWWWQFVCDAECCLGHAHQKAVDC